MVEAAEVELAIELLTNNVSVGNTIQGTVWTENGTRASGVTVSCLHEESSSEQKKTSSKTGKIEFELDNQGTYTITAGDGPTDTPYISDSKSITVSPDPRDLKIIPARTEAAVGEEIRFTVRDSRGKRVEGARVRSNGQETRVDNRGVGKLQFNSAGEFEVTATKKGKTTEFDSGSTEVKIVE
jgi:plastocyanin